MTAPLEVPSGSSHAPHPTGSGMRGAIRRRDEAASHGHETVIQEICPYLTAVSGAWRSSAPHREHRCGAVDPPGVLSAEKQRRLCLSIQHGACPAFRAARASRASMLAPGLDASVVSVADAARRPIARTSALVLEHPRLSAPSARWPLDRAVSQVALVVLMVVAFGALAVARLSSPDPAAAPISSLSPSDGPSPSVTPRPTPRPSPSPSSVASPAASGAVPPSAAPSARTYKVKKGDTLVGIASTFGTTAAEIRRLNGLTGSSLKVGQVLKIP